MRKWVVLAGLLCLFFPGVAAAEEAVPLPVRKVVLYKNGMGYFEHLGEVREAQSVEIVLPASQLNDVRRPPPVFAPGPGRGPGAPSVPAPRPARRWAGLPLT